MNNPHDLKMTSWGLLVDKSETSRYSHFSQEDRLLIDERLSQESSRHIKTTHMTLPTVQINERLTALLPTLKNPFEHSLSQGDIGRRIAQRGETLCRVTGASRGSEMKIFDATGGLCREAQLMSACGAQVWSCERSLPLYLLSKDALNLAQSTVKLIFGEALSKSTMCSSFS